MLRRIRVLEQNANRNAAWIADRREVLDSALATRRELESRCQSARDGVEDTSRCLSAPLPSIVSPTAPTEAPAMLLLDDRRRSGGTGGTITVVRAPSVDNAKSMRSLSVPPGGKRNRTLKARIKNLAEGATRNAREITERRTILTQCYSRRRARQAAMQESSMMSSVFGEAQGSTSHYSWKSMLDDEESSTDQWPDASFNQDLSGFEQTFGSGQYRQGPAISNQRSKYAFRLGS